MNTKRRAKRSERGERGAIGEIRAAVKRLGAGWLYSFARRTPVYETRLLAAAGAQEATRIAWEALAFAKGSSYSVTSEEQPPTWADVTKAYTHLWLHLLTPLKLDRDCAARWAGRLHLTEDGIVRAQTTSEGLSFVDAFLYQATDFLRQQATAGRRLRFCQQCGKPFAPKRPDAKLCPGTSCRTLAWRRADPKRFREARKRAYRRKILGS